MNNTPHVEQKILAKLIANQEELKAYTKLYSNATRQTVAKLGVPFCNLLQCTPRFIGEWMQDFWWFLPDNPGIHCKAFYIVCDIAESYCELDYIEDQSEDIGA